MYLGWIWKYSSGVLGGLNGTMRDIVDSEVTTGFVVQMSRNGGVIG